jgi:hypothetical protein
MSEWQNYILSVILWILIALLIQFTLFFFYYYNCQIKTEAKINYIFETLSDTWITTTTYEENN